MKQSTALRNRAANDVVSLIDAGSAQATGAINYYTGSPPASPNDADAGTLLATLPFTNNPAFNNASSGTATSDGIDDDPSAASSGTVGHFRVKDRDRGTGANTTIMQGTVGLIGSGADIEFDNIEWTAGATVKQGALRLTIPVE